MMDFSDFFEDEDDERLRINIAQKVADQDWLFTVGCQDYNISVRRAAVQAIEDPAKLTEVAIQSEDRLMQDVILAKGLEDKHLSNIAIRATDPYVRVEATHRIEDKSILAQLLQVAHAPDVVWFSGRRLGKLPIAVLKQIKPSEVLVRAAEQETQKIARMAAIREIQDEWALERLSHSEDAELAEAAHALRKKPSLQGSPSCKCRIASTRCRSFR